jgi:hypothetical protein
VDRLAQFLNKVFDLLVQCHLPVVGKQVLRERLASPMLECPSHALGIPCQCQRERQLRVKIVLVQDYAEVRWKPSPDGDGIRKDYRRGGFWQRGWTKVGI